MLKYLKILALAALVLMMMLGGYNHIVNPEFYNNFIPEGFPKLEVNYASAIVEIAIAILLILPGTRRMGAMAFIALMVGFMPIHVWDYLKEVPAIGSKEMAAFRIVMQFVLIALGYWVYRNAKNQAPEQPT